MIGGTGEVYNYQWSEGLQGVRNTFDELVALPDDPWKRQNGKGQGSKTLKDKNRVGRNQTKGRERERREGRRRPSQSKRNASTESTRDCAAWGNRGWDVEGDFVPLAVVIAAGEGREEQMGCQWRPSRSEGAESGDTCSEHLMCIC